MDRQNLSVEVLADRLMEKLDQAIDELNLEVTTRKVKIKDEDGETTTEELEITKSIIDRMGLKQLTSVLKELQTIKGEFPVPEDQEDTGVILLAERREMQNAKCEMQNECACQE